MKTRANSKRINRQARREERRSANLKLVSSQPDLDNTFKQEGVKRDNSPIVPRNPNQERYLNALRTKRLIFSTGDAGTGKTFLCTSYAAELLLEKEIERIIVTRPVLQAGEDLGFLPGDVNEKFAPYFRPVYDVLQERLGGSFLQYCLKPGVDKVEIAPFAFMRGRTFKNAVIILDEAQNVTESQMKLFLTRIGENCTVIVNGDVTQCDLPTHIKSGLADALNRFNNNELVSMIRFDKADSVRSELCQMALDAYA